ncbi:AfsR/SARP family transcriptional regulator [Nocardia nepalensis]|uniref:AfsR/SARP family transcriptional regulator n=1 Tax=Nocardia nepalensis TaxID=3375448 RepID=UPI003B67380F
MTVCVVGLLGGFTVGVDGRTVPDHEWRRTRAAELVKLLALAERHRMNREQLIDQLWPDLDSAAGAANLRKAMHFARRALGSPDAIASTNDMLELFPAGSVIVDAEVFENAARHALATGAGYDVADSYSGDLLPEDRYASWAEEPRDRLRGLQCDVLRAARQWERVLAIDPTDEQAHRGLMRQALDAGDRAAVVRQFSLLRRRLRADLGIGPDRHSIALYEKALAMSTATPPSACEITQSLLARALVQLNSGDYGACELTAARARALAIESGLGRETGEASAVLGILANMRGEWPSRFLAEFADSVGRDRQLAAYIFDAQLCLAEFTLFGPAGHEWIAEYAVNLRSAAEQSNSLQGQAVAELLLGEIALFSARLDEAVTRLATAAALHKQGGTASGQVLSRLRLAEAMLASDQRRAAAHELADLLPLAESDWLEPHLVVRTYTALVEVAEGERATLRQLEQADRALRNRNVCRTCSVGFHLVAAKALAAAGQHDRARRRLAETERLVGMWPGGAWHASLWEARAVLHQSVGDLERARSFYLEAADRFGEVGRPLDRMRCARNADAARLAPSG